MLKLLTCSDVQCNVSRKSTMKAHYAVLQIWPKKDRADLLQFEDHRHTNVNIWPELRCVRHWEISDGLRH